MPALLLRLWCASASRQPRWRWRKHGGSRLAGHHVLCRSLWRWGWDYGGIREGRRGVRFEPRALAPPLLACADPCFTLHVIIKVDEELTCARTSGPPVLIVRQRANGANGQGAHYLRLHWPPRPRRSASCHREARTQPGRLLAASDCGEPCDVSTKRTLQLQYPFSGLSSPSSTR